jgi:hypothetical protein
VEYGKHGRTSRECEVDAYLFCRSLLQQFRQDSNEVSKRVVELKIKNVEKCMKCCNIY